MDSGDENNTIIGDFLSLVENDSSIASFLFADSSSSSSSKLSAKSKKKSKNAEVAHDHDHRKILLKTCQNIFKNIEDLAQKLDRVDNKDKNDSTTTTTTTSSSNLSGLDELYLGGSTADEDDDDHAQPGVDAETLWGQVDLQNEALHAILKKSVKKLGKVAAGDDSRDGGMIQLLDTENEIFNDDDDGDENEKDDSSSSSADEDEGKDEDGSEGNEDEEEDEVTRRMRERMERALQDQEEEDDDNEGGSEKDEEDYEDTRFFGAKKTSSSPKDIQEDEQEEDLIDPAAEELNNGFFDINEMEAFADEEEDMLPEEVWEPTPKEKKSDKKAKSFHQRQREGMQEGDSEDDDDDDDDQMEGLQIENTKRKKYREDDEIEALHSMYSSKSMDDDDVLDDAVNMTAADLFGRPNKKYFHKWKSEQQVQDNTQQQTSKLMSSSVKQTTKAKEDDDANSWDEYDFEGQQADWGASRDDDAKPKAKEDDSGSGSDASDGEDDEGEAGSSDGDADKDYANKKKEKKGGLKTMDNSKERASVSRHARQTEKLKLETERLEKEMISEKPWQMVGEASATARPVNSLLDGTPEFQVASKMAPVITEQHTEDLEEVIKRRILNEDWDDVIPRELPDVAWHKKRGELPEVSQEKAKLGLGELYEREYLKKAIGYDADAAEKQSEEDKAKNEMKQLFANICSKLDALSNYHFAPRPVADEAEVRPATTPAIAMEEVLPLHVSDARGVAPEEVYAKKRGREGILRSETELEQTERKRIRSAKKEARRKSRKEKAADDKLISRIQPGLGLNNPYEKRKMREELSMARAEGRITDGKADLTTGYGSSSKFFNKMQSEVSQAVRDGTKTENDDEKEESRKRKSSSFKM